MKQVTMSRRAVFGTGAGALVVAAGLPPAASARTWSGVSATNQRIIQEYYGGWVSKDWGLVDTLLTDDFTFTSAAPDDHISKTTFKTRCWDTQSALIESYHLERAFGAGDEAFVKYLCRTKAGQSFRNVEYLRFKGGRLEAIECYFGRTGYPSAANARHT